MIFKLRNKLEISPFIRDIIFTTVTSFLSVISAVIVTRLLAEGLGPRDFGAYSISRRMLGLVAPVSVLGMDIALTRYIAITTNSLIRDRYFITALTIAVIPGILLFFGCMFYTPFFAGLIYKDPMYQSLFTATIFLVVGYSFFIVLYAYYRGSGKMNQANLWQVGVVGVGPVIVVAALYDNGRVSLIVFLLAALFFCTCIPIVYYVYRMAVNGTIRKIKISDYRELLEYGIPRVPAGFAIAGILGVGPFLAPQLGTLKEAGYLSAAQGVLAIVESGVVAFGLVALPKIAHLVAVDELEFLSDIIKDTIAFFLHLGLFATLHVMLWSDEIVNLLLGSKYQAVIPIMRIFIVSLIPYLGYVLLRSVIDAVEKKAFNTLHLFVALGVTLILDFIFIISGAGTSGLAWGTTIGLITLGILTIRFLWRKYRISINMLHLKEAVLFNMILIVIAGFFKYFLHDEYSYTQLFYIFLVELVLFTLFIFMLWKVNVPWLFAIKKRIVKDPVQI